MNGTGETLNGWVVFIREGLIVLVLLLLLLVPRAIGGVLERAGFTKASLAGFEWELRDSVQTTNAATQNVAQLEQRLASLSAQLDQLKHAPSTPPEVKDQIGSLARDVASTTSDTRAVQTKLQNSLMVQRSIIQRVNPNALEDARTRPPSP
jgi:Tfp pilus assembly protein PilO